MGNEAAVEATTETIQPEAAKSRWLIHRLFLLAPTLVAAFGVAGFAKQSVAGWPIEYTAPWLALVATAAAWACTIWFAFLRKPSGS